MFLRHVASSCSTTRTYLECGGHRHTRTAARGRRCFSLLVAPRGILEEPCSRPLALNSVQPTHDIQCITFFSQQQHQQRSYVSRAHPQVVQPVGVHTALRDVLEAASRRQRNRQRKALRNVPKKNDENDDAALNTDASASAATSTTTNAVDETIELALNLNLDPRKPNQSLRGSVSLPNGSGKAVNCLVFTGDAQTVELLHQQLSTMTMIPSRVEVGGEDLMDRISSGQVNVDAFDRGLATTDIQSRLSKTLARVLGPRGLMPNAKTGTLVETGAQLQEALQTQLTGKLIQYRTDKEGIVHVRLGRASFGHEALLTNLGAVMKEIFAVKPDVYGKGKKSSKHAKYLLRASVSSTQGKGYPVDTRTLDPSSPFFLNYIEGEEEDEETKDAVA